ncbi:MAG TPA: hypothetical protein VMU68_11395 [Acidimicrobiales bacterium]|nr:hypothetical protein [Acidimicrobiales bacterium]
MRVRRLIVVSTVFVFGVGLFLAGRASTSNHPVPTPGPATSSAVKDAFSPFSVDFSSVARGWTLGMTPCHVRTACLSLRETTNAGRSWSLSALPQSLLHLADRRVQGAPAVLYGTPDSSYTINLNVRFANSHDGWIFGSVAVPTKENGFPSVTLMPTLWSTHDGGRTWKIQPQSWIDAQSGPVLDLEASSSTVYVMATNKSFGVTVESSPVGRDSWHVSDSKGLFIPAGGAALSGAIVLFGPNGWLIEGNDRGITGSAQLNKFGRWVPWTPPCESVGDSLAVPAASTAQHLVVDCVMGGFASPLSRTAPRGATLGSTWLYVSDNAGRTFTAGPELSSSDVNFVSVLASPTPSTIFISRGSAPHQELSASFDGGHDWSVVFVGNVSYVHFVSSTEGVALVWPTKGANQLIMTFDGGYHWLPMSL